MERFHRNLLKFFNICLILISLCNIAASQDEETYIQKPGYLVSAPAIFRSGVDQTISVRIFNHNEAVRVNAKIIDARDKMIASTSEDISGSGVLTLQVPKGREGKATLHICGDCHLYNSFNFQNSTPVTIVNKGVSAFIQTDKPVYKPRQSVMITVFAVSRDLRPMKENVTAYVLSPDDVRMVEWKNLKPVCCGTIQIEFPLSEQPPLGTWKIFAEINNNIFSTTFEIRNYVLPKFEVSIYPPPFYNNLNTCENVVIESAYTFGKPVIGNLFVNATVTGVGYSSRSIEVARVITKDLKINGKATFSICLSDILDVNDIDIHYTGALNIWAKVTSDDGSTFTAYTDATFISKQKVNIEFTEDTRKHFKSNIPFNGKISAKYLNGDLANNVLIRLKVEVNNQNYVTFDAEIINGVASFTVPAIPQTSQSVWLDARVIAVDGVQTGDGYLSIYRELVNWHAPSNCHILAEGPSRNLIPGETMKITVKSSCPCNFKLYYDVLSRGNIIHSGKYIVNAENSEVSQMRKRRFAASFEENVPTEETEICQTYLHLTVTPNMAPLSKLLVYYIREDGEGIADSIHLPVTPKLENPVTVLPTEVETAPGKEMQVKIKATENSCVCVAIVDKSVHLMKPGYFLTMEKIFEEMKTYDMDNIPFDDDVPLPVWALPQTYKRKKRSADRFYSLTQSRDAKFAFLESGLIVMTDIVSLDHKMSSQVYKDMGRQALTSMRSNKQNVKIIKRKLRTYFPETWLWKCFSVGSGVHTLNLNVPDTITTWQANAVGLSTKTGIGVSPPASITSLKKFFMEFNLPYSAIRGEQIKIPMTVHNYLSTCVTAKVSILAPNDVMLVGTNGAHSLTRKICLDPDTTEALHVTVEFSRLGKTKISAVVDAFEGSGGCCGVEQQRPLTRNNVVANDGLSRTILVEAEGEHHEYTHSVFFCPNDRLNITTPKAKKYHFIKFTQQKSQFSFVVKAKDNVHIALSNNASFSSKVYEIVLGGSFNQQSWISHNGQRFVTAATDDILSQSEFRAFWIKWENGNIEVGHGTEYASASRFMQSFSTPINIQFVGFATGEGTEGEFRLWKSEAIGNEFLDFFKLELPANFIPGSQRGEATMLGDIMGPTLKNLNQLLKLPYGCGEQNMVNFAPNVYILNYLKQTNQLTSEIRDTAVQFLQKGYQRQLTYKRSDGSYSAFGDRDNSGSMWLTSFVLKSFSEASHHVYIDSKELHEAKEWILSWQDEDGSFPPVGRILNKDLQGGINAKVSLTAYVVIALLDSGLEQYSEEIKVSSAIDFLERSVIELREPYSAALTAYALTIYKSPFAEEARSILFDLGLSSKGNNEIDNWSIEDQMAAPVGLDLSEIAFGIGDSMKQSVSSANIEMTSFALLAVTAAGDLANALPIVKWISRRRNALGGFSSTQDTCVALQSLSEYATYSYIGGVNLKITLASNDMERSFVLNNDNLNVMQKVEIPQIPIDLFISSKGEGCALLQTNVRYNTPKPTDEPSFDLSIKTSSLQENVEPIVGGVVTQTANKISIQACMRWIHKGSSNMAVLEIPMLTGLSPDLESLGEAVSNRSLNLKRFEFSENKVIFYFDEIPNMCKTCVTFQALVEYETGKVKSQPSQVYDYYEPAHKAVAFYHPVGNMAAAVGEASQVLVQESDLPDGLQCSNSITGCNDIEPTRFDDIYNECKCYKQCGFSGPIVCGSDGVTYLNECRMQMAACETDTEIRIEEMSYCSEGHPKTPDGTFVPDLFPLEGGENTEWEEIPYEYDYMPPDDMTLTE